MPTFPTLSVVIADFNTILTSELAIGATSATISAVVDDDNVALASGQYYLTLDSGNSQKEHILCDLAVSGSITTISNIKSFSRAGAITTGVVRKHRVGATVVGTDHGHIKVINDLLDGTTRFDPDVHLGYDSDPGDLTDDDFNFATIGYVNTHGGGGGGGGGTASFISTNTLSAVALPDAALTKITEFTGLTGDTDDEYLIKLELTADASRFDVGKLAMRFNSDNAAAQYAYQIGSTFAAPTDTELELFANAGGADPNIFFGQVTIKASKTIAGTPRATYSDISAANTSVKSLAIETKAGFWNDTTNQMTSIQLYIYHSSGAARAVSGKVSIYKINRTALPSAGNLYTVNADEAIGTWQTNVMLPGSTGWGAVSTQYGNGAELSAITTSTTNGLIGYNNTTPGADLLLFNIPVGKKIRIKCTVVANCSSSSNFVAFGFANVVTNFYSKTNSTDDRIQFLFDNASAYAVTSDTSTNTNTTLSGVSVGRNVPNICEMVWTVGTDVKFYINGALVATHTTSIPTNNGTVKIFLGGNGAGTAVGSFSEVVLSQSI